MSISPEQGALRFPQPRRCNGEAGSWKRYDVEWFGLIAMAEAARVRLLVESVSVVMVVCVEGRGVGRGGAWVKVGR